VPIISCLSITFSLCTLPLIAAPTYPFAPSSLPLEARQLFVIPAQELPLQTFHIPIHSQPCNHTPRLLRPQQSRKLLSITLTHLLMMNLANLPLHFCVYDAGPDGDGGYRGFFRGEGEGEVVEDAFCGAVGAPADIA
jgi:hypothetical protein